MPSAPLPENESERILALLQCQVLDTEPEPVYDALTRIAARVCDTPIALISLVDTDRQWFKSRQGLDAPQTDREQAFCGYTILGSDPLIVHDASTDPRTCDNPLVTGEPGIRFYAGAPLRLHSGQTVGSLCVIDTKPREHFSDQMRNDLIALTVQVSELLQLRIETRRVNELNADLHEKQDEMEHFVYSVSHDLKSPLTTCKGFVNFMREDLANGCVDEALKATEHLENNIARMGSRIDDLLNLSQVGHIAHTPERIDMNVMLEDIIEGLRPTRERVGACIRLQPGLPQIVADRARMTDLFENLIVNAMKYACDEPGAPITIGAEKTREDCRFYVRDVGPGIDESCHRKIFHVFQRLTTSREGTGIGLAIVARIMKSHGGRAWVESQPGDGACFWVAFPPSAAA